MPVSGLALAASAAVRVASLNLCTDEYLLLLARGNEIVSVSHLARNTHESVLWARARRYPGNDGSMDGVIRFRPNLVLTMGGGGRATSRIAARLGIRVLDLPYPQTLADLGSQATQVAAALGEPARAHPFRRKLVELQANPSAQSRDAAFLGGGGLSLSAESLGAQWMELAGARQRSLSGGRLTLETLATNPPKLLIRSDYRRGQASLGQSWLSHPLVRRLANRTIMSDGRPWTCAGLPMIEEVERLRRRLQ